MSLFCFVLFYIIISEQFFFLNYDSDIIVDSYYINSIFQNGLLKSYLQPVIVSNYGWPSQSELNSPINEWSSLVLLKIILIFSQSSLFEALNYFVLVGLILNFITFYLVTKILNLSKLVSIILAFTYSLNLFFITRMSLHIFFTQIWIMNVALIPFFLILQQKILTRFRTRFLLVLFSSFLLGISNNYFILFTLILYLLLLSYLLYKSILSNERFKLALDIILSTGFIVLTFLFNSISWTGLFRSQQAVSLLKIADSRQDVESLMFSGSPFSLLSYQFNFIFDILHLDFRSYLEIFSSIQPGWTESVGNRFELQIVLLLIVIAIWYSKKYNVVLLNSATKFLIFCLIITLGWFIQGGFGFFFSVFLSNSVRGWGRLILVVNLFSTLLIGLILTAFFRKMKIRSTSIVLFSMIVIFLLGPIFKDLANINFSENFNSYNKTKKDQKLFFSKINSLPEDCSVVILPYYPFPEFNSPNDRLNDYDLMYLSLDDNAANFKWNIGATKWSADDRWFSPLSSDLPNFASTNALTQIAYASHYNACAAAINMGMFRTQGEEVSANFLTSYGCSLLGDINATKASRSWLIWDLRSDYCRSSIKENANLVNNTFSTDLDGPLLWRFTNISPEYYSTNLPVFDSSTSVELDFMTVTPKKRIDYPSLSLRTLAKPTPNFLEFLVCFDSQLTSVEQCKSVIVNNAEIRINLNQYLDGNRHKILIIPKNNTPGIKWATLITY